ncbi:MAG: hypothetical protein O3B68_20770 [Planctomycetota bacterium]|nr:hypothetical protein [Planctomycetota bacterium]
MGVRIQTVVVALISVLMGCSSEPATQSSTPQSKDIITVDSVSKTQHQEGSLKSSDELVTSEADSKTQPQIRPLPIDDNEPLSRQWQTLTEEFVRRLNIERAKFKADLDYDGEEVDDSGREKIAEQVLSLVHEANRTGEVAVLREKFAPAHGPFLSHFDYDEVQLPYVAMLDDGRIILQVGRSYDDPDFLLIDGIKTSKLNDFVAIGRSPNRRYFSFAMPDRIIVRDGWDGPIVSEFEYPSGVEGVPEGFRIKAPDYPGDVEHLVPFPDGKRLLLVAATGVFVLSDEPVNRLLPTLNEMEKMDRSEVQGLYLDLPHGAISLDGQWITVSHRNGRHLFFDNLFDPVAKISGFNDEPLHAMFTTQSDFIALSGLHYGGGGTFGIKTDRLPALDVHSPEDDERIVLLNDYDRAGCGVYRKDEFIIGNKYGDLIAFDRTGKQLWEHQIGSSVFAIDVSADGQRMAATTIGGVLAIFDLDTGQQDASTVGNSTHRETRRWLFWDGKREPFAW